jgi:hypothetical protein
VTGAGGKWRMWSYRAAEWALALEMSSGQGSNFQISSILTTREYLSHGFNAVLVQEPGRRCGPIRRASICSARLLADPDSGSAVMDP